jgi:hypothetical protein
MVLGRAAVCADSKTGQSAAITIIPIIFKKPFFVSIDYL